jgi:hypothetical protein
MLGENGYEGDKDEPGKPSRTIFADLFREADVLDDINQLHSS